MRQHIRVPIHLIDIVIATAENLPIEHGGEDRVAEEGKEPHRQEVRRAQEKGRRAKAHFDQQLRQAPQARLRERKAQGRTQAA